MRSSGRVQQFKRLAVSKSAAFALALVLQSAAVYGHSYTFGGLEIQHPAVMVPNGQTDCSCAHLKIVNHGTRTEYFLGAEISIASRTDLLAISTAGHGVTMPTRVKIAPGETLDLNRHVWCLFMSGITATLEADVGVIQGKLRFENYGTVDIEFLIDEASH